MPDEPTNRPDAPGAPGASDDERGGVTGCILTLFLAPILYVFSIGPVAAFVEWLGLPPNTPAMRILYTLYFPLLWLHRHTALREPLEWWIDLWTGTP